MAALCAASTAQAQWTGKAELGVLLSDGNTEAKSANTKLDLTHEGATVAQQFLLRALYGENAEFANAERYEARYQADWKITDRSAGFSAFAASRIDSAASPTRPRYRPV